MEATMIRSRLILSLPILLALSAVGQAQAFSNDCSLQFAGSFPKAVKNRPPPEGATYTVHNDGQPITIADWFGLVCGFDPKLKQKNITTSTPVLKGFETIKVTLEGFLLAARFERKVKEGDGKDTDFHLEISDSKNWKSRHVIVEVPPGPEYCDARKQIFDSVHQDGCGSDKCTVSNPAKIRVTGFIFLDAAHGKTCKIKRGMVNQGVTGAEGAWEIHPVRSVELINSMICRCN